MAKTLAFISGVILGMGILRAVGDPAQLAGYPIERYRAILDKSPFAKETPVEESPTGPRFGQDLVLTGHFKIGEVLYAMILNKKTQERFTVNSGETQADRLKVVSFVIDPDPGKNTAVIQQGEEKATLSFEKVQAPKESQKTSENHAPNPVASATPANATKAAASPPAVSRRNLPRVRYKNLNTQ